MRSVLIDKEHVFCFKGPNGIYWVGAEYDIPDENWLWINGQDVNSESGVWAEGQPVSSTDLACMSLEGQLDYFAGNRDCSELYRFICMRPITGKYDSCLTFYN